MIVKVFMRQNELGIGIWATDVASWQLESPTAKTNSDSENGYLTPRSTSVGRLAREAKRAESG